jgi:hypothetical protein
VSCSFRFRSGQGYSPPPPPDPGGMYASFQPVIGRCASQIRCASEVESAGDCHRVDAPACGTGASRHLGIEGRWWRWWWWRRRVETQLEKGKCCLRRIRNHPLARGQAEIFRLVQVPSQGGDGPLQAARRQVQPGQQALGIFARQARKAGTGAAVYEAAGKIS